MTSRRSHHKSAIPLLSSPLSCLPPRTSSFPAPTSPPPRTAVEKEGTNEAIGAAPLVPPCKPALLPPGHSWVVGVGFGFLGSRLQSSVVPSKYCKLP
uniref:Uncharacterized protein n=1 Tax=Oryza glaberrima TaxID=4538 RepID=I1PUH7_ORYGL